MYIVFQGEIWAQSYLHSLKENKWVDTEKIEKRRSIVNLKSHLHNFPEGILAKGEYQIKFNFELPNELEFASCLVKGSYGVTKDDSYHFGMHVKYQLVVYLPNTKLILGKSPSTEESGEIQIKQEHIKVKTNIFIRCPLPDQTQAETRQICNFNCFFCITKGYIEVLIKTDKQEYRQGDELKGSVQVDLSNYNQKIKKMRLRVLRAMVLDKEYYKDIFAKDLDPKK